MIPKNKYKNILDVLPILCVDIIARNSRGEYLLIKRVNEPKKGRWWVIGGRVLKGETLEKSVERKVREEVGLQVKSVRPVGYFELVNGMNPFGTHFNYHSVSIVFTAVIDGRQPVNLDNQSAEFKFAKKLPVDFHIKSLETCQRRVKALAVTAK